MSLTDELFLICLVIFGNNQMLVSQVDISKEFPLRHLKWDDIGAHLSDLNDYLMDDEETCDTGKKEISDEQIYQLINDSETILAVEFTGLSNQESNAFSTLYNDKEYVKPAADTLTDAINVFSLMGKANKEFKNKLQSAKSYREITEDYTRQVHVSMLYRASERKKMIKIGIDFKGFECISKVIPNTPYVIFAKMYPDNHLYLLKEPLLLIDRIENILYKKLCIDCVAPVVYADSNSITKLGYAHSIYCNASGIPTPEIYWKTLSSYIHVNDRVQIKHLNEDNHKKSNLIFSEVLYGDSGTYVCTAISAVGSENIRIKLTVEDNPKYINFIAITWLPCSKEKTDNHCNDQGKCYYNQKDSSEKRCTCEGEYFGEYCEFRHHPSRYESLKSDRILSKDLEKFFNKTYIQLIIMTAISGCLLIMIIACIVTSYSKRNLHQMKEIVTSVKKTIKKPIKINDKYSQVNTYEPPPPLLTKLSDWHGSPSVSRSGKYKTLPYENNTENYANGHDNELMNESKNAARFPHSASNDLYMQGYSGYNENQQSTPLININEEDDDRDALWIKGTKANSVHFREDVRKV